MPSEDFVYTVDAAQFQAEIKAMEASQRELRQSIAAAGAESIKGSRAATSALTILIAELERTDKAIAAAKGEYKELASAATTATAAAGGHGKAVQGVVAPMTAFQRLSSQSNQVVGQLSFALDDALTVFGTSGFAGAARAAGNNLSYVLAIANPMLAIVPSLATAIGFTLVPKMLGWADASKKVTQETDTTRHSIEQLTDSVRSLTQTEAERDDYRSIAEEQKARGEAEGELKKTRPVLALKQKKYEQAMLAEGAGADEGMRIAEEQLITAKADVEQAEAKIATIDSAVAQRRKAIDVRNRRNRAEKAVGRINTPLQKAAEEAISRGATPKEVRRLVESGLSDRLGPELKEFAPEHAAKITSNASEAAEAKKLDTIMKPTDTTGPLRQRQRSLQSRIGVIQSQRLTELSESPTGKISKQREREFTQESRPFEAELKALGAQINNSRNHDELIEEQKKQTDFLKTVAQLFEKWDAEPEWSKFNRQPNL